jgi:hypothetical protein
MPTKHIDAAQWDEIEQLTVELTKLTNQPVKESEVLKLILKRGLTDISEIEIAIQLEYKPRYNALLYVTTPECSVSTHFERPTVNDVIDKLTEDSHFLLCVYGKTNTGKSTFVNRLIDACPLLNIAVYDEAELTDTDQVKVEKAFRDYASGKSAVVVVYAADQIGATNVLFPPEKRMFTIEEPEECSLKK